MLLMVSSLAERPEMLGQVVRMANSWPEFLLHDPVGDTHYGRIATELPEYVLFAEDEQGHVVAHAYSVPFALAPTDESAGGVEVRGELPARGWDEVLCWAFADRRRGTSPDTVSAISIVVAPRAQGTGLSARMLSAMRDNARARGFDEVVAPVRPSAKHLEPRTPMEEYAFRERADGLPHDPWLRVHVRAGGVIEAVAPASMTVSASLEEWRGWTGLPFDTEGLVEVPGALVPVHCEPGRGYAVYVEPNVWVRHTL
ncbi:MULTISPECIES: GNAT family N-acetyltransferase [Streptomyces]|uniref:GNAT family N-acetyltransferase n=1 Tax=Streptomyces dengpaensis TaxID=2049881 RepID=A0ABN5IE02_9ACTN|nr:MULTISPECIES: GNAT family N-acetyltransferase [Streptomyces]AVH61383.1 GNAT family N-acetyltransferase [Streptomyces dengpaensis]PIB08048.1 N-acetyltransferase [Streptomyces sp. HG99]